MTTNSLLTFTFAFLTCFSAANGKGIFSDGDSSTYGWISSGGESLIYARNPWFVKNTLSVDYCLQMDEASFSIAKSEVPKLIAEAFQYWKDEFAINTPGNPRPGIAKIATQKFNFLEKCDDKTPLIFKFGLKNLDTDETKYLTDPKKYIGVTIRKEYLLDTLKGNGVI